MKKKLLLKNVLFGFGGQCIIMILGIVIPRIMIKSYGSDLNGLIGTIGQIFTYMALIEAGIGQAASNALYKPLSENDHNGVSYIVSIAQKYFRKIAVLYGLSVIGLAFFAPFILKTNVKYYVVVGIILLEGMSGVCNFYFIQTWSVILYSDGKSYFNNGITLVNKIVSYVIKIMLAMNGVHILILEVCYFLITIAKAVFYSIYFKKNYSWINYHSAPSEAKLKDRNSYVLTEIAWTIFSSTDMIVLSSFVSTSVSSVYTVYNLVFGSISSILSVVYNSVKYALGQAYHRDIKQYEKIHDIFISIFLGITVVLMSVSYMLANPFITIYTSGITDINYIYKELPLLFSLVQIISWSRYVQGNLTGLAGYAKTTSIISTIEAIMNVVGSVILVRKFGIVGVLLATVIALPLKVIWCVYISDKKVLHRSYWKSILILGGNYLLFGGMVFLSQYIIFEFDTIFDFVIIGFVMTLIISLLGISVNMLINLEFRKMLKKYLISVVYRKERRKYDS